MTIFMLMALSTMFFSTAHAQTYNCPEGTVIDYGFFSGPHCDLISDEEKAELKEQKERKDRHQAVAAKCNGPILEVEIITKGGAHTKRARNIRTKDAIICNDGRIFILD
jgi:hypothetical protein